MRNVAFACALLLSSGAALAHHSFAVFFDTDSKLLKVSGVVKDFRFTNPHGIITVEVPGPNGTTVWNAETNSPSMLRRRGWTPESLHIGDKVTVEGWPARDGTRYMRMNSVRLSDGQLIGQPMVETSK